MSVEGPIRALVVDDDPASVALVKKYLTDAGYDVLTATNGSEAMRVLLTEGPSIIIADWMMPVMDGIELCRMVRSHEGILFAYIIVLTAQEPSEERIVEALDAGADDYLVKPIRSRQLLARVRAGHRIAELNKALQRRAQEVHCVNAEMEVAHARLREANDKLDLTTRTDELTGLSNRREAMAKLEELWNASIRHDRSIACIQIDIDHFKSVNDTYGHAAGDAVLRQAALVLGKSVRKGESVFRIGGEEFLVVCPYASAAEAAIAAERLRRSIERATIPIEDRLLKVTVSLGVAERLVGMKTFDAMLHAADEALYAAKRGGRNRVCIAGDSETLPASTESHLLSKAPIVVESVTPATELSKETILLVDDCRESRDELATLLSNGGYSVQAIDNAADALSVAGSGTVSLIMISGRSSPNLDRLDLVRRIKGNSIARSIPVMVTGSRNSESVRQCINAGADEFIASPIDRHELALRTKSVLLLRKELQFSNGVRGEQSRALQILLDFSQNISIAFRLDEILQRTLNSTIEMTCCRRAVILMRQPGDQSLRVVAASGFPEPTPEGLLASSDRHATGKVFSTRYRVVIESGEEMAAWRDDPMLARIATTPCVITALIAPEGPIGVLILAGRQDDCPFTPLELEYIDLIANFGASAIADCMSRSSRDDARDSIVIALAKLAEHRDSDTGKHVERVCRFSTRLAEELRMFPQYAKVITDQFLYFLERAVPLHDIGKVAVPDSILLKPTSLTAEELVIMRTHCDVGARTIRHINRRGDALGFLIMAEQIAQSHHERFDGRGYPQGLAGTNIPLAARIASVADVYDAITTKRVYKEAMPHEKAVSIIRASSGFQFDPDIVEAFLQCERDFEQLAAELCDMLEPGAGRPKPRLDTVVDYYPQFAAIR